jgi:hypothetical protein
MERALSTINYLPSNKREIKAFSEMAVNEILSGNNDLITVAIQLKSASETFEAISKDERVKEAIRNEVEKYGKMAEFNGSKIELAETGVKYDFSDCNCQEWKDLDNEIKRLTEAKKGVEAYLKGLKEQTPDLKTGEMLNPPIKTSMSSFKITLK